MARFVAFLKGIVLALGLGHGAQAAEATIAVASNFLSTAGVLAGVFKDETGHELRLAHGATGRLFAQITNGAPFDVFLAADAERPAALAERGLAVRSEVYALGTLALVARKGVFPELNARSLTGHKIAMANPEIAPYGAAARGALQSIGLAEGQYDAVFGDSVGQAAAFFVSGNVDAAVIAMSQVPQLAAALDADFDVDMLEGHYAPFEQVGVLLPRGEGNAAATAFFDWLTGPQARGIIRDAGYRVPE